jgi:hypothetical protein
MRLALLAASLLASGLVQPAHADSGPCVDAKPLSEILRTIEQWGDLAYFKQIEWEDGGWKIEYATRDRSDREVDIDPRTGEVLHDDD